MSLKVQFCLTTYSSLLMKYYLLYLLALCATSTIAQDNELEPSIRKGNWQFEFLGLDRLAPMDISDSMLLYKSPKRLKMKKNRPVRFKQDGTVSMPQVPLCGCGTVGTLESLWYLKWKE